MNVSKFECLSYHNFRSFYMAGGGKSFDNCFRSSKRVNTSVASLFQTTVVTAFKLRGASEDKSFPGFLTAGSIASIYVHK